MPTIDQLDGAIVASDDDMVPVSQNGIVRRVSRSQLLAGTQATLSLSPGLIGRVTPGLGPPQQIAVGGGLSLSDGILSGSPRFSAALLPLSTSVELADLVPTWQNGQDSAVSVRTLLSVGGVDVSNQLVTANVGVTRKLADWTDTAVPVECFGARGDGTTDDTHAINLAIASGRPVLFGPRTYRVDGQWNVQASAILIGTVGITVLRRVLQQGGAWISVTAPAFTSIGIVFDAGNMNGDSWGVFVAASCIQTFIQCCAFSNSTGLTLGSGLTIQARDGLAGRTSSHVINRCSFQNNACHGIWVQATSGAEISDCQAWNNGSFGICLDFNDPMFQQTVRQSSVKDSRCWNNARGISVGNYNESNSEPPRWGLANPDASDILVSGNICFDNSAYGIAVSGTRIQVVQNQISLEGASASASGILCNASLTTVADNSVVGPGQFGIDAGGCADVAITSNIVIDCATGLNAGGSDRVRVASNKLVSNGRAITVFQVETDGQGSNFGMPCRDIWIESNLIQIDAGNAGIALYDGPERVEIVGNRFFSKELSSAQNLCWAHTDTVKIRENTWNGLGTVDASSGNSGVVVQITIPDIIDRAIVSASTSRIDAVFGLHQLQMLGQLSFVKVINGGTGYNQANVVIAGLGAGATSAAYLRDGVVIGIAISNGGSGYEHATTSATIIGDGTGALLHPFVGLPVPQDRRVSLHCLNPVHFTQDVRGGVQTNWTKTDFTVSGGSEVVLQGFGGLWQAIWFESIDYLQPGGDGSVTFRSSKGDLRLNAGAGGVVRFCSNVEQVGFATSFGRGSPEGVVAAPPGSDYRDLGGGAGTTLWLKRVGTDSSGWFPVA